MCAPNSYGAEVGGRTDPLMQSKGRVHGPVDGKGVANFLGNGKARVDPAHIPAASQHDGGAADAHFEGSHEQLFDSKGGHRPADCLREDMQGEQGEPHAHGPPPAAPPPYPMDVPTDSGPRAQSEAPMFRGAHRRAGAFRSSSHVQLG
jgi:hypothetical protein